MPDVPPHTRPLGWSEQDLRTTIEAFTSAGADAGTSAAFRFVAGVAKLIKRRINLPDGASDARQLSAFVLPADPTPFGELQRRPMFYNGRTAFAGSVWIVNAPVASARRHPLPDGQDEEALFRCLVDELTLGGCPSIVVDQRHEPIDVRFYPMGLADPDNCQPVPLCSDVDVAAVSDVISRVHAQCLVTPDAQIQAMQVWEDASRRWPHRLAETSIQAALKPAFVAAFPTCIVKHEIPGVSGRIDLQIEEDDWTTPGQVRRLAVVELKVLRSRGCTGTPYSPQQMLDCVESGIKQAACYRDEGHFVTAALCCFDMRDDDTQDQCFEHVKTAALRARVALRRWYLFSSSEKYRDHLASFKPTTTPSP